MGDSGVRCPSCGRENEPGQRFCGSCGATLSRACPSCGALNPPDFRFCGSCGASLEAATAETVEPEEGERRWASVLFADLSGFTSFSERRDPEDVTIMIDRCMGLMGEIVERYGGYVARVIGDELMALFGAPRAHEDDAERAVRAGLELLVCARDHAEEFGGMTLRVGVNTGDMMFGPVGPDREFTVMGDAVNLGKRLETASPPGRVMVGEETHRASAHAITYEPTAPFEAKGKTEPVTGWLAVAAETEPAHRPVSGAPIVGRDRELHLLQQVWSRVEAEHRPHLATVIGPPGIGKTRTTDEFLALRQEEVLVLRGRSLPYGESTGYGAFAQQLGTFAGVLEGDPGRVAVQKLQRGIDDVCSPDDGAELRALLPALAGLDPEDVPAERGVLFLAARRFVEALARRRPTILVFEDVHWADASLLDLIEFLASRAREAPLLLLTLARPELLDLRSDWGGGLPSYTALHLESLPATEAARLIGNLLPGPTGQPIVERLVETAGGNPLFLEELVATLSERPEDMLHELPTSVTGIIAARLDLLPAELRRVLLGASAVGKVFWRGALAAAMGAAGLDEALDELEARDLIRREEPSRIDGETQYRFKHMLIREVAYQTLPRSARRARHEATARFIEEAAGARLGGSASLLAHHWRQAGDTDKAIDYLLMAAQHASNAWAKGEAVGLYTEALELIPESDAPRRRSVLVRRAIERGALAQFDGVAEDLDPILDELEGRERVEALIERSRAAFWLFRTDQGIALGEQAVQEAERAGIQALVAPALAMVSQNMGAEATRVREAIETGERALSLWEPGVLEDYRALNLTYMGLSAYWLGEYEAALGYTRRCYDLSRERHVLEGIVSGGANHALALTGAGRHEEAIALIHEVIAFSRDVGGPGRFVARAFNVMAGTLREMYDAKQARANNEEAIELAGQVGFAVAQAQAQVDLGHVDLLDGDVGGAAERIPVLRDLAEKAKGFHQWLVAGRLQELEASVALAAGDAEQALELAHRSLQDARRIGRLKYEVASGVVAGRALLSLGRPEEAVQMLVEAERRAQELRHPPSSWSATGWLSRALAAVGRDGEAERAGADAGRTIRSFAEGLSDENSARFLAQPNTEEVLALGG